ncbi:hypothetical protein DYB36_013637, partial [Aphanomyces astaci]
ISLARACYADADVYILDALVFNEIFPKCILGLLRHKKVVLITHHPDLIKSGHSSLTMALFRINELASGTISIDGIDTATLPLRQLRRGLAIIPQNPVHFKGTLHTNLDPLDTYSDNQLWAALGKVKLLDRLTTSDAKLEQPVDEKGDNFSVGERQMLCMARALLGQAKILVLERVHGSREPTDEMLQRVIRNEFAGATPLTIAHRLGTILDYDRILVFDHGTLMQNDTPDVLLADTRGAFYELAAEGGNIASELVQY